MRIRVKMMRGSQQTFGTERMFDALNLSVSVSAL
jgi:hypothetical protein